MSRYKKLSISLAMSFVVAGIWLLASCAAPTTVEVAEGAAAPATKASSRGAGQIWADNCSRCHNSRSPDTLSDAQWEVAVLHMRIQAGLTGEEQRAVVKFLQASN
jgi:mono/diheme cytochrome c family protein